MWAAGASSRHQHSAVCPCSLATIHPKEQKPVPMNAAYSTGRHPHTTGATSTAPSQTNTVGLGWRKATTRVYTAPLSRNRRARVVEEDAHLGDGAYAPSVIITTFPGYFITLANVLSTRDTKPAVHTLRGSGGQQAGRGWHFPAQTSSLSGRSSGQPCRGFTCCHNSHLNKTHSSLGQLPCLLVLCSKAQC